MVTWLWFFCFTHYFIVSVFNRFSNLQTRSCSTAVEGAWALAAQSLLQGKLRNDTSSLPSTSSTHPSCPLYLSSPFFHQTARNQTYTQGFFPFLSVLLKTFNVMNCLSGCVRAQMTNVSRLPVSIKIMCAHVHFV